MSELIHALTLRLQSSGERAMLTLIGYLAASLLVVFAFAAFVYAGATALTAQYGPVISASIIGGVSIVLALIVFGWLAYRRRKLKRQMRLRRLAQPAMAGVAASALPLMMRASPIGTLLAVAVAGYVLQRSTQKTKMKD
jgi:type VI protein secretion system component VasK